MAPVQERLLILYTAAIERSLGRMLAQNNVEGKENAMYYTSQTIVGVEINYSLLEKIYLAIVLSLNSFETTFYTIKSF